MGHDTVSRSLRWWVGRVRRHAWSVIAVVAVATALLAGYTARNLGLQTDTNEMLSADLEWRKINIRFDRGIPDLVRNITIVVRAINPDLARDGASKLARRLAREPGIFNFVFYPPEEPFFRKNGLLFLKPEELGELSDQLAEAQPLLARLAHDLSLRGLFDVLSTASDAVIDGDAEPKPLVQVFDRLSKTIEGRLEGRPLGLSWRELIDGESSGPNGLRQVVLVQPNPDYRSFAPAKEAIETIRKAARDLGLDSANGYSVRLTGSLTIQEEELESVARTAGLAGLISLVLVGTVIFAGLRSGRLVWATLAVLIIGLIWTAGFAAIAVGELNLISVAFAVLFLGLSVDFGIQFGLRYRESIDQGAQNDAALGAAGVGVGRAICLSALTSAIGFFAFVPTDYVGMAELGIIAGTGIFIALFLYLTLLPAMLAVYPLRRRTGGAEARDRGVARMAGWVARRHRTIVAGSLILVAAGFATFPLLRFEFDPIKLKDPTTESVQTYMELARDSETSLYTIGILAPDLATAKKLGARLEKLPEVDHIVTLAAFTPDHQEEKLELIDGMNVFLSPIFDKSSDKPPPGPAENRAEIRRLAETLKRLAASPRAGDAARPAARLATQLDRVANGLGKDDAGLRALERDLLGTFPNRLAELEDALDADTVTPKDVPDFLRRRYVALDGSFNVEVHPSEDLSDRAALRRFVSAVTAVEPTATDNPVVMLEAGDTVIQAFKQATAIATVLIVLVLIVILRRLVDAALVLAPVMLAAALSLATTVVFGIPFNFANVIALPLLIALGVDFGIHLILRYRETGSVVGLLRTSTPRAVFYSGLTTMCSFGSLIVSDHRGTASMGYLLLISLTLALVCALVVLPALLAWREALAARRAPAE